MVKAHTAFGVRTERKIMPTSELPGVVVRVEKLSTVLWMKIFYTIMSDAVLFGGRNTTFAILL